jgi:hypothetical protein
MHKLTLIPAMVAFGLAITSAAALGQSQPSGPSAAPDQNAPSHFDAQAGQGRDLSLSERLDRSGGVIHPPSHVDPEMPVTPPTTRDKMPIVPPPGGPGGDQRVKPK